MKLAPRELEVLQEIARQTTAEDPAFARALAAGRLRGGTARSWVLPAAVAATGLALLASLIAGLVVLALISVLALGTALGLWIVSTVRVPAAGHGAGVEGGAATSGPSAGLQPDAS